MKKFRGIVLRNLSQKMGLQLYPGSTLSLARALSVATATFTQIEKEDWKTKMYFETAYVETSWARNARGADRQATSRSFHKRNVEKTTRMNDGNEI